MYKLVATMEKRRISPLSSDKLVYGYTGKTCLPEYKLLAKT